jgi:hypothetical protein
MKELLEKVWNAPPSEITSFGLAVLIGVAIVIALLILAVHKGWIQRFVDWMLRIK